MAKIKSYGITDVGLVRKSNEDAFLAAPERGFWVVSDGMGGEDRGEMASKLFVETAQDFLSAPGSRSEGEESEIIKKTYARANERILAWAKANGVQKMGCTAEMLVFRSPEYILGHVGDSRTYRFRGGQLKQLTHDHSLVQQQLDEGLISVEEARKSPWRNVILRAVGTEETLAVDLLRGKASAGDQYLLCSDGLTSMVGDRDIEEVLSRPTELIQKVNELIEKAKAAGGVDNITVVLCEIREI